METTEIQAAVPAPSAIPPTEMGHSLLALMQTHTDPAESAQSGGTQSVETLASQIEGIAEQKSRQFDASQSHSLRMAEMYESISTLLDLLHDRIVNEPVIRPEPLEPLALSMTQAFGELQQQLQASEERQLATLENTFKHWESKLEGESAGQLLQMESSHLQAQIEVNRLLRVMWLGTGLAAAGAGIALFLVGN